MEDFVFSWWTGCDTTVKRTIVTIKSFDVGLQNLPRYVQMQLPATESTLAAQDCPRPS